MTRPVAPLAHGNEAAHRRMIAVRANASLPKDGTEGMSAPLRLQSVVVADLPDATLWTGALLFVTDETGGAVVAFSDGTNWKRVTDLATVS